jgi:tRNA(Ile)-lysidine synthase
LPAARKAAPIARAGAGPPSDFELGEAGFARRLERLGPFETKPRLAVAVSGGADSLALAILAARWARARGGHVTALTVDHGLRPESAREAATVGRWLKRHGIAHRILPRRGPLPAGNIQAEARRARYRLLEAWCAARGIVHLLLAHHREDQAETLLMRLERGSGAFGLAAMPAIRERPALRWLRPLLDVPRAALADYLRRGGQPWIEDPSNRDHRFARVRWRAALAGDARHAARLADAAAHLGGMRAAMESAVADRLARCAVLAPESHALLDPSELAAAGAEIGRRALAALLTTVGGGEHAPRQASLVPLYRDLVEGRLGRGRTLAGCRVLPLAGGAARVLVCRELRGIERVAVTRKGPIRWDGRFVLLGGNRGRGLALEALGEVGWAEIAARAPWLKRSSVPAPARAALAALRLAGKVRSVPQLGYDAARPRAPRKVRESLFHLPAQPLAPAFFAAPEPVAMP